MNSVAPQRSHIMHPGLTIRVLAAVLAMSLAITPTAHGQTVTARASTEIPPQLTSGAQVDAYLTRAGFHGYILLARHGRILLSKGYGLANVAHHVPINAQTRWPMFGIETFEVAVAILKLQEEGKLRLQDALCPYLAGCPSAWRTLTLRQLLDGTSPLDNSYNPVLSPGTIDDTIAHCAALPLLDGPPGVSEDSECNRVVLSRVIERVTHGPFDVAMQQLVFRPAGMANSAVVSHAPPLSVLGYLHGGYASGTPAPPLHFTAYPLVYSTLGDVARLDGALLAGKILSRQSLRALVTPYRLDAPDPVTVYNGYGCQLMKANRFFFPSAGTSLPVKTNRVVFESDSPPHTGFIIDNFFSPDDGSLWIEAVNDPASFGGDADNSLMESMVRLLWGA